MASVMSNCDREWKPFTQIAKEILHYIRLTSKIQQEKQVWSSLHLLWPSAWPPTPAPEYNWACSLTWPPGRACPILGRWNSVKCQSIGAGWPHKQKVLQLGLVNQQGNEKSLPACRAQICRNLRNHNSLFPKHQTSQNCTHSKKQGASQHTVSTLFSATQVTL